MAYSSRPRTTASQALTGRLRRNEGPAHESSACPWWKGGLAEQLVFGFGGRQRSADSRTDGESQSAPNERLIAELREDYAAGLVVRSSRFVAADDYEQRRRERPAGRRRWQAAARSVRNSDLFDRSVDGVHGAA
jgi:hypothetical protein